MIEVLKVVGANHAPSDVDSSINLSNKLGIVLFVSFDLSDLARAAVWEAQLLVVVALRHLAPAANREAQLDSCLLGPCPWFLELSVIAIGCSAKGPD